MFILSWAIGCVAQNDLPKHTVKTVATKYIRGLSSSELGGDGVLHIPYNWGPSGDYRIYIGGSTGDTTLHEWVNERIAQYISNNGLSLTWGSITGTLSNQTDLQTALDGKIGNTGSNGLPGASTWTLLKSTTGGITINKSGGTGDILINSNTGSDGYDIQLNRTIGDGNIELTRDANGTGDIIISNANSTGSVLVNVSGVIDDSTIVNQGRLATQLADKQDIITGAASSITSSNLTIDKALISSGAGKVTTSNTTASELGYLTGVTSFVQTQLDAKQSTITGGASSVVSSDLTINRALVSNGSGKIGVSTITSTELATLTGISSNIQDQLDAITSSSGDYWSLNSDNFLTDNIRVGIPNNKSLNFGPASVNQAGIGVAVASDSTYIIQISSVSERTDGTTSNSSTIVLDSGKFIYSSPYSFTPMQYNEAQAPTIESNMTERYQIPDIGWVQDAVDNAISGVGGSGLVNWGDIGGTLSSQTDLQTALNSKQATITGAATTITSSNLTTNRALISNGSGKVAVSSTITSTELGYLDGVTSNIQTQINAINPSGNYYPLSGNFATSSAQTINTSAGTFSISNGSGYVSSVESNKIKWQSPGAIVQATSSGFDASCAGVTKLYATSNTFKVGNASNGEYLYFNNNGTYFSHGTTGEDSLQIGFSFTNGAFAQIGVNMWGKDDILDVLTFDNNSYANVRLADPVTDDDAATKRYVDDAISGIGGGGGISNVVEDLTPQLGGNLDLNGHTVGSATATDLTKLNSVTSTATELNYTDGVTSNIQTQLNAKQATITGAATTITSSNLTANRVLISNGSGKVAVSSTVSDTELGYLDGATSNVQTQINNVGGGLYTISIDIGDWNMSGGTQKSISQATLQSSCSCSILIDNIRRVSILIRDDFASNYYDLITGLDPADPDGNGYWTVDAANNILRLYSLSSGYFDGTNFDATSYNRGWITIEYAP